MASQNEVAEVIAYLALTYSALKPSAGLQAVWHDALGDINAESLMAAAREHVRASKYKPTIAELRERAGQYRQRETYYPQITADSLPPATPEQIRQRCAEAIAKIQAAPDIGGPGPDPRYQRNKALDGGAGTTRGPEPVDWKAALDDIQNGH
jgi:hypothetical protein